MNNKQFIIICLILVAGITTFLFLYKQNSDEKNNIEYQKIEAEELIKQAEIELEQEKIEAENTAQENKEEFEKDAQLREECLETQRDNLENYENFINACTKNSTIDECIASEIGQLYADDFSEKWISDCINYKKESNTN